MRGRTASLSYQYARIMAVGVGIGLCGVEVCCAERGKEIK